MARGFLQDGRLGVAEPINRLLPVADDEDRRVRGHARAFTPGLNEERHELPLGPAGVLELVDEHVVIAGLETEAALRELVHPPQQLERAIEHVGKVEHRSAVEDLAVLGQGDGEHPLHAAREHDVEVAVEGEDHVGDARRELEHARPMALGRVVRLVVLRAVGIDDPACPRAAVGGQEMGRNAIEDAAERGVARLPQLGHALDLAHEQPEARVPDRTVGEKLREASRRRAEDRLQPVGRLAAHALGREVGRPLREKAVERMSTPRAGARAATPRPSRVRAMPSCAKTSATSGSVRDWLVRIRSA